MNLQLSSTKDSTTQKTTVLLYGENGSGKTTFAATWPNPVFLVPEFAANEMKSLSGYDLPVLYFENRKHLKAQVEGVGREVAAGNILCNTFVVDNLTAGQLILQEELKEAANVEKMRYDEWDKLAAISKTIMLSLHKMPPHVIWITHSKVAVVDDGRVGELTLAGASKRLFPSFADMLLRMEVVDLRKAGIEYRLHLKPHDIWTCRTRCPREASEKFPAYIVDPHYDKIAALMGWKSCAEIEGRAETTEAAE